MFECDCPPDNCAAKVQCYLQGQRSAGDELVAKFTPLIRSIVQRVLGVGRREEWEDACQAIFLRAFANLHRWEGRCPFCKWLAVVAARRAIDLTRAPQGMEPLPPAELPDPRPPPPDQETLELLEATAQRFPPEWREVWELWKQGTSREQMARQMGRSVRTIQYWLAEMFDQFRDVLSA